MIARQTVLSVACAAFLVVATRASAQPAPDASAAIGKNVRVTMPAGAAQTGRLVSLTGTEAVLRVGRGNRHFALNDVTRIETAPGNMKAFAIMGAAAGFATAVSVNRCARTPECITPLPAMLALGGAGVGAMVGAPLDDRETRLVYGPPRPRAPGTGGRTTRIGPLVSPTGSGARLVVGWGKRGW